MTETESMAKGRKLATRWLKDPNPNVWPIRCLTCETEFFWWLGKENAQCPQCSSTSQGRRGDAVPRGYLLITADDQ